MDEIVRCACYTRKSVEDATLDRDFNSLTSQREACENYIESQRSKGWVCLPEHYDDGGYSGGNMNRPAMTRLKADIEAGKIDMVICFKIDRLSRSIIDFAELQKFFEEHKVHFVSVTQDINTSNSSGRMLLNILITFAAFERDLIIERVKTAIDGGKKRGKFCGGVPMLGYRSDPFSKKLLINEEEAATVRLIYEKYMALESIQATVAEINRLGLKTREWVSASTGKRHSAKPWNTTSVHRILTSPIYADVRAYATNAVGTTYSDVVSFTTQGYPPTLAACTVTDITTTSATFNGNVTSDNQLAVTSRGFHLSTSSNFSSYTFYTSGNGTGSFRVRALVLTLIQLIMFVPMRQMLLGRHTVLSLLLQPQATVRR